MGIERFFSSINKDFKSVSLAEKKIICSDIYFDFNSIVHNVSSKLINEINQQKISTDNFTNLIINNVKKSFLEIIKNHFQVDSINNIMICIDGVPTKAKIMESKKRRFIGAIIDNLLLKNNHNVFNWEKSHISPGTFFMKELTQQLNNQDFINEIKKTCVNLDLFVVSDSSYVGEAEKKIVDCLHNIPKDKKQNIVIYSPDADMILLLMLLNTNNSLKILRITNDTQNVIDINLFKKEIFDIVIKIHNFKNIDSENVIKDFIFIFTFLGDDFLPKLQAINTKYDIEFLINIYVICLVKTKKHLVEINKNYRINTEFLKNYLEILNNFENKLLMRNYMDKEYKNYMFVKINNFICDIKQIENNILNQQELLEHILKNDQFKFNEFLLNFIYFIDPNFLLDIPNLEL